jgi:drug/metabolite transporter (DMT)-like permease
MEIGIYVKLVLTMIFWGGTFVAAKWAVREAPPFHVAACRFAVATAVLFLLLAWKSRGKPIPVPRTFRQWLGLFSLGLTGIFLYNACFFAGLRLTTAANGSLIVAMNPILTAVLSALFLGDRLRPLQGAGFVLSLAGVAVVVSRGSWEVLGNFSFNHGDLILLGAPVCWSAFTILGKKALVRFSPLATTAWSSLFGLLLLAPAAFLEASGGAGAGHLSWTGWLAVLQLALLGTVAGFVWFYEGVHRIGAARAAVFINLVPFFAILQAALILGERLNAAQAAGGLLVIGGVWLGQRK